MSDGRARYLVRKNLQDVDEEIAELGDGSVILCTDDYTIYDDIEEYDGIDAHLAITHDDAYVIGDVHVNSFREPPKLHSPVVGEIQRRNRTVRSVTR